MSNSGADLSDTFARSSKGHGHPSAVGSIGDRYIDLDAVGGAVEWINVDGTSTGWQVVYGDTGACDFSSLINPVATPQSTMIRRCGQLVDLYLDCKFTTWTSGDVLFTVPSGFRTAVAEYMPPPYSGVSGLVVAVTSGAVGMYTNLSTSTEYRWAWQWTTNDAWPTTLPGA